MVSWSSAGATTRCFRRKNIGPGQLKWVSYGFNWFHHKFVISEVPYEFSGFYMYIYIYIYTVYIITI